MSAAIMEGLTATIIGMGIVFGVLALLAFVISFSKLLTSDKPVAKTEEIPFADKESAEDNEAIIQQSDEEIFVVISAAVAAFMGERPYVIKSVKPRRNPSTPWNIAARRENQRGIKF